MSAVLRLQKASKTFRLGETIAGTLEVETKNHEVGHEGITIHLEGHIAILRSKMSFSDKETIVPLLDSTVQIVKPGKLPASKEKLSIPFHLVMEKPATSNDLIETYHGVNINVQYTISGEIKRGLLAQKICTNSMEIFAQSRLASEELMVSPQEFLMTPESVSNRQRRNSNNLAKASLDNIDFEIKGHLDSNVFQMDQPLTGEICVIKSSEAVKSIEIQLIRIEEIEDVEHRSEVQNIQVAEGNVVNGLPIPLFMLFPRYFSCPCKSTSAFGIKFEANVSVVFADNRVVGESFGLTLYR